jgi:sporulation protein YlmC with PRC-barrel domain
MGNVMRIAVISLALTVSAATAQEAASPGVQLVGLPVFAGDGQKVGQVADVTVSDGRIDQIRILAASSLGFGARTVAIPQSAFVLKGTSVLIPDMRAEDIEALPTVTSESHGGRNRKR